MAGLGFPRDLAIEAYLNGWVDVTTQVRQTSPISITRGRSSEQAKVAPSKLSMVMHNPNDDWNPRNPTGDHYGLLGRNTPFRLGIKVAADTFTRSVSNGWGTATAGGAWSTEGTASLFAVTGSAGTQQVAAANAHVNAWLSTFSVYDAYVRVDYTPPFTDVTGGAIEPATIMLRRLDADAYYMMRVVVTTSEQYQLQVIRRRDGLEATIWGGPTTVDGITHTNGQTVAIAAMIEGRTIFGKVWLASGPEPYDWQVIVSDDDDALALMEPGSIGIRSGVAAGNSNSKPITFTYDNLDVRDMRMAGELSEITQDWDESHANKRAPVKVEGLLRRLGQGDTPVKSTLRRAYDNETGNPLVAYWHGEDGPGAASLASGLEGAAPMTILEGAVDLSAFDKFNCSAPLPLVQNSRWYGPVPPYTPTGAIQLRFLMAIPNNGTVNGAIITQMYTTGSALRWEIHYGTGGSLSLNAFDAANTQVLGTGLVAFDVDGKLLRVSVELEENGGDIDYRWAVLEVGQTVYGFDFGTLNSHTIGRAADVGMAVGGVMTDVCFGHISVQEQVSDLSDQYHELRAWIGETAGNRARRLCDENNVPFAWFGDLDTTAVMGPQKVKKFLDLVLECANTEQGILFDMRGHLGLVFRTRHSLYAQVVRMTLNYAQHQIANQLKPAEDDRGTINDVTAKQLDGSEARAVQEEGPLNVGDPWTDPEAVGRYDTTVNVNVYSADQLPDIATFVRALGTTTDPRFPTVTVNLRAPDVAAITASVLAADIGDRAVLENLAEIGLYDDVDQMVHGYTETFVDSTLHTIKFNVTPYAPYRILVLDDELGRLDSSTTTLNEDLDETETSVDIINSLAADAEPWITTATHPTHFPFRAEFGGERVVVTAATGSGPTYTWTVQRSDNNVEKTHLSGTPVRLADPVYLGR